MPMTTPTNPTARSLAERLIKTRHWRDSIPGWLSLPDEHGRIYRVDTLTAQVAGRRIRTRATHPSELLPDLDDPATLGCLLALVQEAWGGYPTTVHFCRSIGKQWEVHTEHPDSPGFATEVARGHTRAEALVAALECAP